MRSSTAIVLAVLPALLAGPRAIGAEAASRTATHYVVAVSGMTCPASCAQRARATLLTLPGVDDVEVDFKTKMATITMKEGKKTDRQSVENTLRVSGFGLVSFTEK